MAEFDSFGARIRAAVLAELPEDWSFDGRRMLDFGCGSGRLLRRLFDEAAVAEIEGCDIDPASVDWARANLCPPIADVFRCGSAPPLDRPDGHYDLIVAFSVFTHIGVGWADWLLELHRVLADDGILIASFLGRGAADMPLVPWDEDRIGMNVINLGRTYETGDPGVDVLHSRWWLQAHWGRAFELLALHLDGFPGFPSGQGHGVAVLRKRPAVSVTAAELEREEPGEERYALARRTQLEQFHAEALVLRSDLEAVDEQLAEALVHVDEMVNSRSWRLTAPLRALRASLGGKRRSA
jgi:SAM-dependent methyltransferase